MSIGYFFGGTIALSIIAFTYNHYKIREKEQ